jgi:hypothetical protein
MAKGLLSIVPPDEAMAGLPAPTVTIHAPPEVQAKATIRILSGAAASRKEWDRAPSLQKRKIMITDESGRRLTLYLIEFQ